MRLKLCCPVCKRTFGFKRTRLEGIWYCVYCVSLFKEEEILAREEEAGKEYEDAITKLNKKGS